MVSRFWIASLIFIAPSAVGVSVSFSTFALGAFPALRVFEVLAGFSSDVSSAGVSALAGASASICSAVAGAASSSAGAASLVVAGFSSTGAAASSA